jgi:hypothetical protein
MLASRIVILAYFVFAVANSGLADESPPQKPVTLLGMLTEWRYPDSKFNGAQMGDAGVRDVSAIKSRAVLTTPDSAEKVMKYYRTKLNVDAKGKHLDEKEGQRITTERSVLIQDLSAARPCKLYVIAINGPKQSTTLVVSRSDDEAMTHIAWSNYRQLWP